MSTTSGRSTRDEVDRLASVGRLADDLDVVGRPQQHGESAAHERLVVGDRDPDHGGGGHSASPYGSVGDDAEAAARRGPGASDPP